MLQTHDMFNEFRRQDSQSASVGCASMLASHVVQQGRHKPWTCP
jgi:hypothetical protein